MTHTKIIILAAGASTRLGSPKQLLQWQGRSLLQHTVQVAAEAVPKPVVVLGVNAHQLQAELDADIAQIVHNSSWQEGIASSIHAGLSAVLNESPPAEQVIFMVCDQPYVSADLLKELIREQQETGKPIVASAYAGTLGIPALFTSAMFSQLLDLKGDMGAKRIIQQHPAKTATVHFPLGNIDIDTTEEYRDLVRKSEGPEVRK
jgi:molybdenum cofactor cytidylyltransferase